jgi:hypothetical protein
MAQIWGREFNKKEITRRVGDMRQLAAAQPFELSDGSERGVRCVRLYNAAGLDFTVVPDRGMAITHLSWLGRQLSLLSPIGTTHPAYSEQTGLGWLRTWPAGFLTVCGLTQVGSPGMDGQEQLGQHGRAASLPAFHVNCGGEWDGDIYTVWVSGTIQEVAVFGDHLTLTRKIWMAFNEPRFWIEDTVSNAGFSAAPHMLLQHFNLGFPLLDSSTLLELSKFTTKPRDESAWPGLDHFGKFQEPTPGYPEQVFYHDLEPDQDGIVKIRLLNPEFNRGKGVGVYWKYLKNDYPILVEWKNMAEGLYVVGIEPANCHVEGRVKEREMGTLQVLQPMETRVYRMEVGFE